jgi:hypothetical protein
VFGVVADPNCGDELCVTVIATSIDQRDAAPQAKPEPKAILNPVPVAPRAATRRSTISSVIASSNRDLPAYVRYNAAKAADDRQGHAALRAMGAPGEEEFLFEDEALDTPAFIRRNAD